ncbi:uncharacterized protein LOC106150362 [Lingula anatina]|uniref:Glycosyltransferase family 92 protein n=1 Tax=Lingula anatina TaxID=7574 RepID=A0A1S3GXT0_LINAN|nr:uncharacterized protein LOC106150362 [Lingula anatina]|eukprot:XP_013378558.1 uncharacterized protein LOC106150362 [Lingula anatina]
MAPSSRQLFHAVLLLGLCSLAVLSYLNSGLLWPRKSPHLRSRYLDTASQTIEAQTTLEVGKMSPRGDNHDNHSSRSDDELPKTTPYDPPTYISFSPPKGVKAELSGSTTKGDHISSDCPDLPKVAPDIKENFTWWNTGVRDFLVFSAFLDNRTVLRHYPIVRVNAIYIGSSDYINYPKFCQVWFQASDMKTVYNRAYRMDIDETGYQDQKWKPLFLNCLLDTKETRMPYAISVVDGRCNQPRGALKIIDSRIKPKKEPTFGVCIKPLYGKYDGTGRVVEFMEVTKMFGADYFIAYNYSSNSTTLGPVFKKYINDGVLTMVQWVPPIEVLRVVNLTSGLKEYLYWARDLGQQAATNDCLYRLMQNYSHIAMVDYDEFLVPRSAKTWQELFKTLPKNYTIGSYKFLNRFYHLQWKTDPANFTDPRIHKYRPSTLLAITPEKKFWGPGRRPKQFSMARATLGGTIHHGLLLPGFKTYVLQPEDGYMHHYRAGVGPAVHTLFYRQMMVPVEDPDMYLWKFKDEILSRIDHVFKETRAPFTGTIKRRR